MNSDPNLHLVTAASGFLGTKEQLGYEPAQDAKGEVGDIVASYREDGSILSTLPLIPNRMRLLGPRQSRGGSVYAISR